MSQAQSQLVSIRDLSSVWKHVMHQCAHLWGKSVNFFFKKVTEGLTRRESHGFIVLTTRQSVLRYFDIEAYDDNSKWTACCILLNIYDHLRKDESVEQTKVSVSNYYTSIKASQRAKKSKKRSFASFKNKNSAANTINEELCVLEDYSNRSKFAKYALYGLQNNLDKDTVTAKDLFSSFSDDIKAKSSTIISQMRSRKLISKKNNANDGIYAINNKFKEQLVCLAFRLFVFVFFVCSFPAIHCL